MSSEAPTARPSETGEKNQSLWLLVTAPLAWAAHFLASYVTAAVWCAKYASPDGSYPRARLAIAAYTFVALAVIALVTRSAWSRYRYDGAREHSDADTPVGRHRFMGFASLLLCGLSALATLYAALAAALIARCY